MTALSGMAEVDVGEFIDLATAHPEQIERAATLAFRSGLGPLAFASTLADSAPPSSPPLRHGLELVRPLLDVD
jgi:hypothetical protein